jgi:hypothetical protein
MADFINAVRRSVGFASPDHLVFAPVAAALFLLALVLYFFRLHGRPPRTFGSTYSLLGPMMVWVAVAFALALTVLAAARPFLLTGGSTFKWNAVDVVFVVDVSSSMWVQDLQPSRLDIAVREVVDLPAEGILTDGDRAALFVFGTTAVRKAHLSTNLDRLLDIAVNLKRPDTLTGDAFPWSSDLASALEHVYQSLDNQDRLQAGEEDWKPVQRTDRAVVLLTDGDVVPDPEQAKRLDAALVEFQRRGVRIYPVGIGTQYGAALREILRNYPARDYDETLAAELEDQHTRVNRAMLANIARRTGGKEFIVDDEAVRANGFLRDAISAHRSVGFQFVSRDVRQDVWQYLVIAAIVVVALGWCSTGLVRLAGIFPRSRKRESLESVTRARPDLS